MSPWWPKASISEVFNASSLTSSLQLVSGDSRASPNEVTNYHTEGHSLSYDRAGLLAV